MKFTIIGSGKTGQAVIDALPPQDVVGVFNSRHPVTVDALRKADVAVVFVPAKAFADMVPLFMEARTPLVIGTTGYEWPQDIDARLRAAGIVWVAGQNFSLGLNVMRYYGQRIKQTLNALRPSALKMRINEIHHVHKLDAPSGTALYIAKSLDFPRSDITAVREGEVKGIHTVHFDWPHEIISLAHESLDRGIYAEGVLLACEGIKNLSAGLHFFENMADDIIEQSLLSDTPTGKN